MVRGYIGSEASLQRACVQFLRLRGVHFFHVPNGMNSNWRNVVNMKSMGMAPGIPDLLIIDPASGFSGLAVELKVGSRKPTALQLHWLSTFESCGWASVWLNSFDDFEALVGEYFSGSFVGIDNTGVVHKKNFFKYFR